MPISTNTVASYNFTGINTSSLVYSTSIPGGKGKAVTGLSRTTWFAVITEDSKIIFFDKMTPPFIVKIWLISSPSNFLEIDSFIDNKFFITSDASKVLSFWDRSQASCTSPIMSKMETVGSPTLVLALQFDGYFASKINSSRINIYEVKSISISDYH